MACRRPSATPPKRSNRNQNAIQMINHKLIYKILGSLLFFEAMFMLWCLLLSVYYNESDILPFMISIFITVSAAIGLKYAGKGADNTMSRRDAYLVVTLAWTIFSIFGSIPFMAGGYLTNPADAFFETMSGFTTTGATIIDDVERLPHGLLFWRSLTQWIGGLGIVFFTIAILPSLVGGNVRVFAAEATGPIRSRLHPRLSTTAKWIWTVYFVLTLSCAIAYMLGGMGWFDSINYSMSTTATGGFSTHNDSVSHFNSATVEYISILFQFLSGINFTILYLALVKGKFKQMFTNSELRFYVSIVLLSTLSIMALLITYNGYNLSDALRNALFQVVSFMTTTGLFNDDAGQWHHLTWVILAILMFIGACAGSTSGGFKCVRALMVVKVIQNQFKQILHPKAVLPVKVNEQNIPQSSIFTLMAFFAIFVLSCLFTATLMVAMGIDNTNAITISLSCINNVGPTLGTQIGPEMSWSGLPDIVKWMCSILMLVGRLEIFTVIVLFSPAFWKDN